MFETSQPEKIIVYLILFFLFFGHSIIESIVDWRGIIFLIIVILWFIGGFYFTRDNTVTVEPHGHVHESNGWTQYILITFVLVAIIVGCCTAFFKG